MVFSIDGAEAAVQALRSGFCQRSARGSYRSKVRVTTAADGAAVLAGEGIAAAIVGCELSEAAP
jgi:hypothetical protein